MARFGSDNFQVRYGEPEQLIGEYAVTGYPYPLGLAMDREDDVADTDGQAVPTVKVAGPNGYLGFLSEKVVASRDLEDIMLESPNLGTAVNEKVTLERYPAGSQIEVESPPSITAATAQGGTATTEYLLVTSSTGDVTSLTALSADLGFVSGRWRSAQSGDRVCGRFLKKLTPVTALNVRILIEIVEGAVHA
jgi:hypothetical protein